MDLGDGFGGRFSNMGPIYLGESSLIQIDQICGKFELFAYNLQEMDCLDWFHMTPVWRTGLVA